MSVDKYDAFISYSHPDRGLASALQTQMQRYAAPWYRARGLRIFRDVTDLSSAGGLSASIQAALRESRWLVLVASRASASSPWVAQEVQWWLDTKGPANVLIALADGDIVWDAHDFDWNRTTALPAMLAGRFPDEPLWADLREFGTRDGERPRLGDAVAGLVAPVRGVEKAELVGVHLKHRRRTRQSITAAVTALVLLLALAVQQGVEATRQRDRAQEQARIATSRQLASLAQSMATTRLDLAQLYAVEAFRTDPNPQTRTALAQVSAASPHLVGFLPADGTVTALAGSADRRVVVAGTHKGLVHRWTMDSGDGHGVREDVLRFDGPVVDVAVSRDGSVVLGTDGERTLAWVDGKVEPVAFTAGARATTVAVSPAGTYLAVCGSISLGKPTLVLSERTGGGTHTMPACGPRLAIPSEKEMVVSNYEDWSRWSLPSLSLVNESRVGYPINNFEDALATSGTYVGSASSGIIHLWRTAPGNDFYQPDLRTQYHLGDVSHPEAFAVSDDGRRTAVASTGTIYVVTPDPDNDLGPHIVTLDGIPGVNTDLLKFHADNDHLVSASGDTVALWDLTRYGRTGKALPISLGSSCNACRSPWTSVSPDGRTVAVAGESILGASTLTISTSGDQHVLAADVKVAGPPLWLGGDRLLLPTSGAGAVIVDSRGTPVDRWSAAGPGLDALIAAASPGDGSTVVLVATTGETVVRSSATGELLAKWPGPQYLATATQERPGFGAVRADGVWVVATGWIPASEDYRHPAFLLDLRDGRWRQLPGGPVADVAFAGGDLLVRRDDGAVEVWDPTAATPRRTMAAGRGFVPGMAVSDTGTLLAQQFTDGSVTITDVQAGAVVGTFALPTTTEWAGHTGVALASGGTALVTVLEPAQVDTPGTAIIWDLTETGRIDQACRAAGRDLTAAEWQGHVSDLVPTNLTCRR